MKIIIRIFILITFASVLSGCFVLISPNTCRCRDMDALYKYRQLPPGGKVGMTREEVREDYRKSGSVLILNDEKPDVFYFLHGKCPIWKYVFKNNRLASRGYLVMEMGFWDYIEAGDTVPKIY